MRPARLTGCTMLVLLAASLPGGHVSAAEPVSRQQLEAQGKLKAVRDRIARLTEQQHQASARRDQLNQGLLEQARQLDQAASELRHSEDELAGLESELDRLDRQRDALKTQLDSQHEALGDLLRATYKLGHGSDLRLLLGHVRSCPEADDSKARSAECASGDAALARVQRALAYSRYFQADRVRQIRRLLEDLAQQKELAREIEAQKLEIAKQRDAQREKRDALAAERDRQQQLLARAEAAIRQRGAQLKQLEEDRKSLQRLLDQLRDVFADIPAKLPDDVPFARRRGHLPWPLAGAPREQKDGILIPARVGTRVRAVAHGRVAYADWLRGYGMLVIIDHGEGWMSLYGGNESLLRSVGDWVNAGDVVATSGRGESSVAGLYFGLRHKGKPVDARRWLRPR